VRLSFGVVVALAAAPILGAQPADTTKISHDPLFTRRDVYVAAGFAAATILLTPLDQRAAKRLQDSTTQENRFFRHSASALRFMGQPGPLLIGGSLYAVGRVGRFKRVADLGLHGTEALYVGALVADVIKGLAGRSRPYTVTDTSPRSFALLRGFRKGGDYKSFPSGHTTAAFAAASAVTAETSRWWPESTWYVAPLMYGGAAMVGVSRMFHNKHWASDVAMGAAIGTFSGLKVVRYHHSHPNNKIDRWLLSASVVPDGNGNVMLAYVVPLR
jgi:membrane-associated phospholipid phosphatase